MLASNLPLTVTAILMNGNKICTFSFGRRLMVFRGRKTRNTLRDLIVLMSLPLVPLHESKQAKGQQTQDQTHAVVSLQSIHTYPDKTHENVSKHDVNVSFG